MMEKKKRNKKKWNKKNWNKKNWNKEKEVSEKRSQEDKEKRFVTVMTVISILLFFAAGMLAIASRAVSHRRQDALEVIRLEREEAQRVREQEEAEAEKAAGEQRERVFRFGLESGAKVVEAVGNRPPVVELTEENTADFVTIDACRIDAEANRIVIDASAEGIPDSDDRFYYLFAIKPYADGIAADKLPMKEVRKGEQLKFRIPRYFAGAESATLYKFVVAVKKDDVYLPVSAPHYITNPGEDARYQSVGKPKESKKGLLVDPNKLRSQELDDLGVRHAAYNIPVSRILGHSTDGIHDTIYYKYNGKSYAFNGQVMSEYDLVFSILSSKGIEITAILLNDVSYAYPQLLHPQSRSGIGSAPYYAFNATDDEGCEYLAAIGSFLAERYSGSSGRGLVSNWIIGNEINARKEWNYMEYVSLDSYVEEYARAYRIFYNAIKSVNGASRIYISLDQQWDRNLSGNKDYDARDVLDEFNRQMKREGNIDWGLAFHPYNVPLTTPYTWNASRYVKQSVDTPMVSMANIEVVTDYMEQEEFLTEDGEVRSISLSELGYTSSMGESAQAAAMVYAYKKAEANEHVDAILFSRQTDAAEEVVQGLALGLNHADGSHKSTYNVYKYMDTEQSDKYTDFAKGMIGISDWGQLAR